MDIVKSFAADTKKTEGGVWIQIDPTSKVLIARSGNPKFQAALRRELAPFKQVIRNGLLPDAQSEKIMAKVLAETVLLGWDGFTENGKALLYTKEKAEEILLNPAMQDFRKLVVALSEDAELFRQFDMEASAGN